jgi:hypothetical protein
VRRPGPLSTVEKTIFRGLPQASTRSASHPSAPASPQSHPLGRNEAVAARVHDIDHRDVRGSGSESEFRAPWHPFTVLAGMAEHRFEVRLIGIRQEQRASVFQRRPISFAMCVGSAGPRDVTSFMP